MNKHSSSQHEAWAEGTAADGYFYRNRSRLDADQPLSRSTLACASYIKPNERILEIGTANGRILEQLRRLTECEAHGTDPSPAAIADGQQRYPALHLSLGSADKIGYPDAFFDAVLFGFCLYLVDRNLLMRVVAEADRVLSGNAGRLMITDFDPTFPHRNPDKHLPGMWSYKAQYADLWRANPQYVLAEKVPLSHVGDTFHQDPNERIAIWILVKCQSSAYPDHG